jgi:hypothetical protein
MRTVLIIGLLIVVAALVWQRRAQRKPAQLEGPVSSWNIPESWSVGRGELHGKPLITRFNLSLRGAIGHASFHKQLGIAVPFNHQTENGLPENQEMKELGEIEDVILRRFTVGNESLFAGVITTGNMREFVLYTSDEVGAVAKAQQLVKEIRHHQVQFVVNDDPEWNVFKQFSDR